MKNICEAAKDLHQTPQNGKERCAPQIAHEDVFTGMSHPQNANEKHNEIHCTPTRTAKSTKTDRKVWPLLGMCNGSAAWQRSVVLVHLITHLPFDPILPLPAVHSRDMKY